MDGASGGAYSARASEERERGRPTRPILSPSPVFLSPAADSAASLPDLAPPTRRTKRRGAGGRRGGGGGPPPAPPPGAAGDARVHIEPVPPEVQALLEVEERGEGEGGEGREGAAGITVVAAF